MREQQKSERNEPKNKIDRMAEKVERLEMGKLGNNLVVTGLDIDTNSRV